MLDLAGGTTVYLACGATDLRKSYNGLAAVIKLKFQLKVGNHLYLTIIVNYSNSQRAGVILYLTALIFGAYFATAIKILLFDKNCHI